MSGRQSSVRLTNPVDGSAGAVTETMVEVAVSWTETRVAATPRIRGMQVGSTVGGGAPKI
eukprot:3937899-Rhodomonas_salina.1